MLRSGWNLGAHCGDISFRFVSFRFISLVSLAATMATITWTRGLFINSSNDKPNHRPLQSSHSRLSPSITRHNQQSLRQRQLYLLNEGENPTRFYKLMSGSYVSLDCALPLLACTSTRDSIIGNLRASKQIHCFVLIMIHALVHSFIRALLIIAQKYLDYELVVVV